MIATTIQLVIFSAYIIFLYRRFGILKSISSSTYKLQGQSRWLFMAFLWGLALANIFQPMGIYGFLTSIGLVFSGITIEHHRRITSELHLIFSILAIVSAFVGLFVLHGLWLPTVLFVVLCLPFIGRKNVVYWVEIIAFLTMCGAYYSIH